MHLLVPFAAPLSLSGREALDQLNLPSLQTLLTRWTEVGRDAADEWTLSPPHERALAKALGWTGGDGALPWAARSARADGITVGEMCWGLLTPVHLRLGTEQVSLIAPDDLALDQDASRRLFDAVRPQFDDRGFALHFGAAWRWYVAHDSLEGLPTASLDRVTARNVDGWLRGGSTGQSSIASLQRLQSEVQMLLHAHGDNEDRDQRGLPTINSLWLSGCGRLQSEPVSPPTVDERLRRPALAEDWTTWQARWRELDAGPLAELLQPANLTPPSRLTLCGERACVCLEPAPRSAWQRLRVGWSTTWTPARTARWLGEL